MADRYVLALASNETGDIELNGSGQLEVDNGGTPVAFTNSPASAPPTGRLPIWPGPTLISFTLRSDVSFEGMANDIREQFKTAVGDVHGLPATYPNAPNMAAWPTLSGELAISFGESTQRNFGGPSEGFRVDGVMQATLRCPHEDGHGVILQCADDIDVAFRSSTLGNINFRTPSLNVLGSDGTWWRVDVVVPFDVNRTRDRITNGAAAVLDFESAANAVRTRFKTEVADVLSLPTHYDNSPPVNPAGSSWAYCAIRGGTSLSSEIGGGSVKAWTRPGTMLVQLFGPLKNGDGALYSIADTIDGAFRSTRQGGVLYRAPSVIPVGRTPDGAWWQINVSCPFEFDVIAA